VLCWHVTAGGTGRTLGGRGEMSSGTGEKVGTLGSGSAGTGRVGATLGIGVKLAGVDAVGRCITAGARATH
jgi:hypothetical protein